MIYIRPVARGFDRWGSGAFGAPRGTRKHKGVDLACFPESVVHAPVVGIVTKIGFPYSQDDRVRKHFRYVEVTDANGARLRVFYVDPLVEVGAHVGLTNAVGVAQDLGGIYKGITPHIHLEVLMPDGSAIAPNIFFGVEEHGL